MRKAIIGHGWSAIMAMHQTLKASEAADDLLWITGSASRFLPPLPTWTSERAIQALGLPYQPGLFTRIYKNRAFHLPEWGKHPESLLELWGPERHFFSSIEFRLEDSDLLNVLEQKRIAVERLFADRPNTERRDGVPISKMKAEGERFVLELGSGEELVLDEIVYADRLAHLGRIQGLPKAFFWQDKSVRILDIPSRWVICSALQVTFEHDDKKAMPDSQRGFVAKLPRETGEKFDRHLMGYFMSQNKSQWTLFLTAEEEEDNHAITKKIRRMKQTLNKVFADFIADSSFLDTVVSEQVRFQEDVIFAEPPPCAGWPQFKEKKGPWSRFLLRTDEWGTDLKSEGFLNRNTDGHPSDVIDGCSDGVANL